MLGPWHGVHGRFRCTAHSRWCRDFQEELFTTGGKKRGGGGGEEKKKNKKVLVRQSLPKNLSMEEICLYRRNVCGNQNKLLHQPQLNWPSRQLRKLSPWVGMGIAERSETKKASKCRNKQTSKGVSFWGTTALDNLAQLTQLRSTAAIFRLRAVFYLAAALWGVPPFPTAPGGSNPLMERKGLCLCMDVSSGKLMAELLPRKQEPQAVPELLPSSGGGQGRGEQQGR